MFQTGWHRLSIVALTVGLLALPAGCTALREKLPFLAKLTAKKKADSASAGPSAGRHDNPYSGMSPGEVEAPPQPAPLVVADSPPRRRASTRDPDRCRSR